MAKSYLRSKKLLEELLTNRLKSLETIQTILLKLDTAAGDIEVCQPYRSQLFSGILRKPHITDNAYLRDIHRHVKNAISASDVATRSH